MDRQTVYPGQILPETTLLQMAKDSMIGLAKLSAAVVGTSTIANGFATTPTSPASLQVVVAPGEVYALTAIDGTAWSSLAADTTHSIMKQGILLDSVTLTCAAPTTTGQSINYLVEVAYQELDATPVLLPYYNSANPAQPYSGIGNNGLTQNTVRKGAVVVQIKAGASATTGSQITPAPDSGYVGLFVVTVANAQTTITSASISQYSGAPLMPSGLLPAMQNATTISANDIGTAGVYSANFSPAITTLTDKMMLCIKALNTNPGASTFTPAPGVIPAAPIVSIAHTALQGGEIAVAGDAWLQWNSSIGSGSWVLTSSSGVEVAGTLMPGPSPRIRNITTAGATTSVWADDAVIVASPNGKTYRISNFSAQLSLSTVGIGGMDTGSALAGGYLAIYAALNPATKTYGVFATIESAGTTTAGNGVIYQGSNRPAGYTATALIAIIPVGTTATTFGAFTQTGRKIRFPQTTIVNLSTTPTSKSWQAVGTAAIPYGATSIDGFMSATSNYTGGLINIQGAIAPVSEGSGSVNLITTSSTGLCANNTTFVEVPIHIARTFYYYFFNSVSTTASVLAAVIITGFTF